MTFELEPVIRDKHGKLIADYEVRDFYEKLAEELLEAHEQAARGNTDREVRELIDLMTVCTTRLDFLLDANELAAYQKRTILRNRKRGYLE